MRGMIPFNRNQKNNMLERTSPWHNFNNMLDAFFNDDSFFMRGVNQAFKVDVLSNEKEYIVQADLPGVKKEQIKINYNDGTFTINVSKEDSNEVKGENEQYIHRERSFATMTRTIYLENVEADEIKAKLEEGVLTVTLPKSSNNKNQRYIEID